MTDEERREDEIQEAMRTHGITRDDATFLVALRRGEVASAARDVRGLEMLSPEERARSGVDLTLDEARRRDRRAKRLTA